MRAVNHTEDEICIYEPRYIGGVFVYDNRCAASKAFPQLFCIERGNIMKQCFTAEGRLQRNGADGKQVYGERSRRRGTRGF